MHISVAILPINMKEGGERDTNKVASEIPRFAPDMRTFLICEYIYSRAVKENMREEWQAIADLRHSKEMPEKLKIGCLWRSISQESFRYFHFISMNEKEDEHVRPVLDLLTGNLMTCLHIRKELSMNKLITVWHKISSQQ